MNIIQKVIKRPWLIMPTVLCKLGGWIDDETYIKWNYYLRNGKKLNLKEPVTYFDKMIIYQAQPPSYKVPIHCTPANGQTESSCYVVC